MFSYSKMLQYPINIKKKNTRLANIVATQYGGANGNCLSGGKSGGCLFIKIK